VAADVKLIRSEDVELLQKVGEGGSGQVWKALYKHKTVRVFLLLCKLLIPRLSDHQSTAA
jgi:hypothetical protein